MHTIFLKMKFYFILASSYIVTLLCIYLFNVHFELAILRSTALDNDND